MQTILLLRRFAADTGTQLAAPGGEQVSLDAVRVVEVRVRCLYFLPAAGAGWGWLGPSH